MGNWTLGEYMIHELKDGELWWFTWLEYSDRSLSRMSGKAFEGHDTLLMTPWKVESPEERHWEEVEKELQALPKWSRTTYWVKLADIGMSGLMDCKTLREVPEKEATPIMLALGFKKVTDGSF